MSPTRSSSGLAVLFFRLDSGNLPVPMKKTARRGVTSPIAADSELARELLRELRYNSVQLRRGKSWRSGC